MAVNTAGKVDPRTNAVVGEGLKSKYSPSEKGSVNIKTKLTRTIQRIPNAINSKATLNLVLESDKCVPISAPIIESNIPLISIKCGGLRRPSNPKFECHQLSN